jgi:hypothetical protein
LNLEGQITFHNPAASDLFGMDLGQGHDQVMELLQSRRLSSSMEEIRAGNTITME